VIFEELRAAITASQRTATPNRLIIIPPSAVVVKSTALFAISPHFPAHFKPNLNHTISITHSLFAFLVSQSIIFVHPSLFPTLKPCDVTNTKSIPKESAAHTYTGTNATPIKSLRLKCANPSHHSCLLKKYISPNKGESII
jgi:hypothetical protein